MFQALRNLFKAPPSPPRRDVQVGTILRLKTEEGFQTLRLDTDYEVIATQGDQVLIKNTRNGKTLKKLYPLSAFYPL